MIGPTDMDTFLLPLAVFQVDVVYLSCISTSVQ